MKLGKVEKTTLGYTLLKFYGKLLHDYFFYKKVTYIDAHNIPKDKPVLIAPNHQNALMDALAVIYGQDSQPIFLARSDIFQNPFVAKLLYAIKILPVFRIRDGKEKMKLNELIYNKTIEVLEHNMRVAIFPEAQHIDKKHLRPLKKGIQRIAFKLEEKHDFKAGVHIVPVGIYYSNYWNFRSKLIVKYGKPFSLEDYFEDYKADPQKTITQFSNVLHEKISEQIIHISDLEFHDEYDLMRDINGKAMLAELGLKKSPGNKLQADRETVSKLDELKEKDSAKFEQLMTKLKEYSLNIKKLNIKDWVVEKNAKCSSLLLKSLLLIVGLPVFMYGLINNIVAYSLPGLITKKFKDRQFDSSIAYVFVIFVFPFIYLIQFAIVWIAIKTWYIALIYLLTVSWFGLIAFHYHRFFIKLSAQIRFKSKRNRKESDSISQLRKEILDIFR